MSRYTKDDIFRMVEEEDVEFIRLQFTDIFGTLKNIAITSSQLEKALDNKCMFDGSSVEGFVRIEESDMYLYPDYDTFEIFPWRPQQGKVARLICDVYTPDGKPFEGDPRWILNSTLVPFPLDAGILISGLLFFADHAIYTGASYPGTSLLYELTSGLVIADIPLACFIIPAIK